MAASNRESLLSSPDLLAKSVNDRTSSPVRDLQRITNVTPRKMTTDGSNNIKLQDFYLTTPPAGLTRKQSPTRSVRQTESHISPWRIRVRVEAEREEQGEFLGAKSRRPSGSPSKHATGVTKTFLVPLKDGDESSQPPKRGRGRPRKSSGTPAKRPGTPKPRKSRKGQSQSELSDDDGSVGVGASPFKRSPGRPMKGRVGQLSSTGHVEDDTESFKSPLLTRDTAMPPEQNLSERRKGRGRRKTLVPSDIAIDSDASIGDEPALIDGGEMCEGTDIHSRPTQKGDGNQSSATTENFVATSSTNMPLQPRSSLSPQKGKSKPQIVKMPLYDHPTPDPTEEHDEYDSIMESEGFTMVSLASLPSAQQHLKLTSQSHRASESERNSQPSVSENTSSLGTFSTKGSVPTGADSLPSAPSAMQPKLETSRRRNMGNINTHSPSVLGDSSHLDRIVKQRTPSQIRSSPSLPPPVQPANDTASPRAVDKATEGTPKLVRVVKAGIALQGILDSERSRGARTSDKGQNGDSAAPAKSPRDRMDDLFSGFGEGTRRELRAGLRLGEELAKRQRLANKAASSIQEGEDDVFQEIASLGTKKLPTPDQETYTLTVPQVLVDPVTYPSLPTQQLPSPENSLEEDMDDEDAMDWKPDPPYRASVKQNVQRLSFTKAHRQGSSPGEPIMNTTLLERQAEWQRERDAISKEIENASASQVIVIDSDDPAPNVVNAEWEALRVGQDDVTTDVWQIEAHSSSHLAGNTSVDDPMALFTEDLPKPRRSKLPNLWRKKQIIYSDEVEPREDLMYHQATKHHQSPLMPAAQKRTKYLASEESALTDYADDDSESTLGSKPQAPPARKPGQAVPASVEQRVRKQLLGDRWKALEQPAGVSGRFTQDDGPGTHEFRNFVSKKSVDGQIYQGGEVKSQSRSMNSMRVQEDTLDCHAFVEAEDQRPMVHPPAQKKNSKFDLSTTQDSAGISQTSSYLADYSPEPAGKTWFTRFTAAIPSNLQTWLLPSKVQEQQAQTSLSDFLSKPLTSTATISQEASIIPQRPASAQPPLTKHLPFTKTHYRRLQRLYLAALRDPATCPLGPASSSRSLLNFEVEALGWRKRISAWELGVVDAFMRVLEDEGVEGSVKEEEGGRIGVAEVAKRVFSLWAGRVQRGQAELREGEAGVWDARFEWRREAVLAAQRAWKEKSGQVLN